MLTTFDHFTAASRCAGWDVFQRENLSADICDLAAPVADDVACHIEHLSLNLRGAACRPSDDDLVVGRPDSRLTEALGFIRRERPDFAPTPVPCKDGRMSGSL